MDLQDPNKTHVQGQGLGGDVTARVRDKTRAGAPGLRGS